MTAIWTRDSGKSVHQLVCEGAYKTKLPYPARVTEPEVLRKRAKDMDAAEIASLTAVKAEWEQAKRDYEAARRAYNTDDNRLEAQFRADLEAEHGMTGHPKADKLWSKAYSDGHSGGMSEVSNVYGELVDLVL